MRELDDALELTDLAAALKNTAAGRGCCEFTA
jgi:hypothetical protein